MIPTPGCNFTGKKIKGNLVVIKPSRVVIEPTRMSYDTYVYLKALLEEKASKLHRDYLTACTFIPQEVYNSKKQSALDKAHEIYRQMYGKLNNMQRELRAVAGASYKDHPNVDMRKFWGLE